MKYHDSTKSKTKWEKTDYAKWTSIMRKLENEVSKEKQKVKLSEEKNK